MDLDQDCKLVAKGVRNANPQATGNKSWNVEIPCNVEALGAYTDAFVLRKSGYQVEGGSSSELM
jgi:hypothetical protein